MSIGGVSPQLQVRPAVEELRAYVQAANKGSKIFYGPFYSTFQINSPDVFAAATRFAAAQDFELYQVSVGNRGQGFARTLRFIDSNLVGAQGSLPAGYSFIGSTLGLILPDPMPIDLKQSLAWGASIRTTRMSNKWDAGLAALWPSAEYGIQSKSVATTFPNTLVDFSVNGGVGARRFPENAMLYFPKNEIINIALLLSIGAFITTDGLTWNGGVAGVDPGGNGIPVDDPAGKFLFSMEGWRFEKLST